MTLRTISEDGRARAVSGDTGGGGGESWCLPLPPPSPQVTSVMSQTSIPASID